MDDYPYYSPFETWENRSHGLGEPIMIPVSPKITAHISTTEISLKLDLPHLT